MERKMVVVGISPKQRGRMRMGHKVRVKRAMEGEGCSLIVNPMNYSIITRAFNKNKGAEIGLSPDELVANQESAEEIEGVGLYMSGGKVSRFKKAGKWMGGIEKTYDSVAKRVKPVAKPLAEFGVEMVKAKYDPAGSALEDAKDVKKLFGGRVSNVGGPQAPMPTTLKGMVDRDYFLGNLNNALGTNMGNLTASALGNASARAMSAQLMRAMRTGEATGMDGMGLYYSGRGLPRSKQGGLVGAVGSPVQVPALRSQPFSVNFHQQFQLPPEYQKLASGAGLYM